MCIGVPMRVIESHPGFALCTPADANNTTPQRIDTLLLGDQPVGAWVLTFLGAARETLSEERAAQINDALLALNMTMAGETDIDHLFADLVDREPRLPAFLRPDAPETERD